MFTVDLDSFGPVRMPDGGERSMIRTYLRDGFMRVCEIENASYVRLLASSIDLLDAAREVLALGLAGPYSEKLEKIVSFIGDEHRSSTEQTKGAVYGE